MMRIDLSKVSTQALIDEVNGRDEMRGRELLMACKSTSEIWDEFRKRFSTIVYAARTQLQYDAIPAVEFEWDVYGDPLQAHSMLSHISNSMLGDMKSGEETIRRETYGGEDYEERL
jgi:hypothetical protein